MFPREVTMPKSILQAMLKEAAELGATHAMTLAGLVNYYNVSDKLV